MGVKDLWVILSPTSELLTLPSLAGQTVAVDLSCWVCDSQTVHMGGVTKPHLRNLLFRCISLLNAGIIPIFVIEGEAPELKWDTIRNRNQLRGHGSAGNATSKVGKRSRLKSILRECQELLQLLGLPWIQATGEAEATCAALQQKQAVDAVISQDSDVFLYGGTVVLRSFTGNNQKATVEQYRLEQIENLLGLDREQMICLSILLGCDYLPCGIPGVGKDKALKLLELWRQQGKTKPIQRLKDWAIDSESHDEQLQSTQMKKKKAQDLETGIKLKALSTPGFPFEEVTEEFLKHLKLPHVAINWTKPNLAELVMWCIRKLDWEGEYAIEKISPLVTRWIVSNLQPRQLSMEGNSQLQLKEIVKKRKVKDVPCLEVKWLLNLETELPIEHPEIIITKEPLHLLEVSHPQLVESFLQSKQRKGRNNTKPKSQNDKKKKDSKNKENYPNLEQGYSKIPEYFKSKLDILDSEDDEDDDDFNLSGIIDKITGLDINAADKSNFKTINNLESNIFNKDKKIIKQHTLRDEHISSSPEIITLDSDDETDLASNDLISLHNKKQFTDVKSIISNKSIECKDVLQNTYNTTNDHNFSNDLFEDSASSFLMSPCDTLNIVKKTTDVNQAKNTMIDLNSLSKNNSKDPYSALTTPEIPKNKYPRKRTSSVNSSEKLCFSLLDSFSSLSFSSPNLKEICNSRTENSSKSKPMFLDLDDSISFTPKLSLADRLKSKYGTDSISSLMNNLK